MRKVKSIIRDIKWRLYERAISDKPIVIQDKLAEGGTRTVSACIDSANILGVSITHNGVKGGDHSHGGFVNIALTDEGSTSMFAHVERDDWDGRVESLTIQVEGDTERDTLIRAFEQIVKELKNNGNKLTK